MKLPAASEYIGANLICDPVTSYDPVPVEEYAFPVPVLLIKNVVAIRVICEEAYILTLDPVTPTVRPEASISKSPDGLKNWML